MAYTRVNWVDNVTPLDQVNLNKMDSYIKTLDDAVIADAATTGAKVDKDSVVTAATRIVASKLLAGDAQPALQINGDGKINWGGGGANGVDTNLYRAGADTLKTDDSLHAVGQVFGGSLVRANAQALGATAGMEVVLGYVNFAIASGISFGTNNSWDTNLYRTGVGTLKTDNNFRVGNYLDVDFAGAGYQIRFGSAVDTNLYRASAASLKTDGSLTLAQNLVVGSDNASRAIYFGSALDTSLYRSAANELKTDDFFKAAGMSAETGNLYLASDGGSILFGATSDANLYRYAANQLKTNGYFYTGLALYANHGAATQIGLVAQAGTQAGIVFGSAGDTTLYRSGVNTLKTDGAINVGAQVCVNQGLANQILLWTDGTLYFGSANDTYLYRAAAATLATAGQFQALGDPGLADHTSLGIYVNPIGARGVEVGVANSGGSGYRMLRVPN